MELEIIKLLTSGTLGTAATFILGIVALAIFGPKIVNAVKGDRVEGNVLDRLLAHEKRMNEMDSLIHKQQVKVTRLVVLVTHLNGLLTTNGIQIPEKIEKEITDLTEDL
jgi:hypothetical protein